MPWYKKTAKNPPVGMDCIVLTSNGMVTRATRDPAWYGGFKDSRRGACVAGVTHFMEFKMPGTVRTGPKPGDQS